MSRRTPHTLCTPCGLVHLNADGWTATGRRVINDTSTSTRPARKKRSKQPSSLLRLLKATTLFVKGDKGLDKYPVRYGLIEAWEIIASHIPHEGPGLYQKHALYPEGVQERRYHTDLAEVHKVRDNAARFEPRIIANTNPDGINGPPVTDRNGVVLGGNSRAMTQQLLYLQGKGDKIRDTLLLMCGKKCYGLTTRHVEKFSQPILVRVIEDIDAQKDPETAHKLVRRLNESFTQNLDFSSAIVAIGSSLPKQAWGEIGYILAAHMDEGLSSYLSSRKSIDFIRFLRRIGVLTDQNVSQLVHGHGPREGLLTRQGRSLVRELLLGKIVKDPDILDYATDATYNILESIAPYVIISGFGSKKWGLRPILQDVLPAYNAKIAAGSLGNLDADLAEVFNQISLFGGEDAGAYDKVRYPEAALIFHAMYQYRRSINQIVSKFRRYAEIAAKQREEQGTFLGASAITPLEALVASFGAEQDNRSPSGWAIA